MFEDKDIQSTKKPLISDDSLEHLKLEFFSTQKNSRNGKIKESSLKEISEKGEEEEVSFLSTQASPGKSSGRLGQARRSSEKANQNEDSRDPPEESEEPRQSKPKTQCEITENSSPANQETSCLEQFCNGVSIIINPAYTFRSSGTLFWIYLGSITFAITEMVFVKKTPLILYIHLVLTYFSWTFISLKKFGCKTFSSETTNKYKDANPPYEQLLQSAWPTILAMTIFSVIAVIWILIYSASHVVGTILTCLSLFLLNIVLVSYARRKPAFHVGPIKLQIDSIIEHLKTFDGESEEAIRVIFENMTENTKEINDGTNWIAFTRVIWLIYGLLLSLLHFNVEVIRSLTKERSEIISLTFLCYLLVEINLACFRWKFSKSRKTIRNLVDVSTKKLNRIYTLDPKKYLSLENGELPGNLEEIDVSKLKTESQKLRVLNLDEALMDRVWDKCQTNLLPRENLVTITERLQRTAETWIRSINNIEGMNQQFSKDVNKTYKEIPEETLSIIIYLVTKMTKMTKCCC